ncbi:DUF1801 domain-containing protein [Chitinophaga nivalis]|uniref:DUF1801 domain-containing protein n=1 Tax=Chitinophaga nivalis TaxID=2991709 RepID=A0ABT3IET7_9BACT|nr:DUF1801 domain-containing protein [Chitinophaga nivalis]MCW3467834.1 DUF1801 domain-containing protein [Chitinophaga nivalis]MCW3482474.1 DUF1801 domain-containing protein [Chitinophaga nivalis]
MKALDNFYLKLDEPIRATFLALQEIIMSVDKDITHELKYGMPFFCYKGKMFCYCWTHKKYLQPYIGIVEGKHFEQSFLIQEKRSRMKIMLIDPAKDLPVKRIKSIIQQALQLYKSGIINIKKH